jgi:hypothetical protein
MSFRGRAKLANLKSMILVPGFLSLSALILRSAAKLRVSKDAGGPSFETHCFAMLLRMRPRWILLLSLH